MLPNGKTLDLVQALPVLPEVVCAAASPKEVRELLTPELVADALICGKVESPAEVAVPTEEEVTELALAERLDPMLMLTPALLQSCCAKAWTSIYK